MSEEVAHYWRHPGLPGVELLRARFVTHRYARHAHEGYTIALIESGVEEFDVPGAVERAGAGALAVINPEVIHTGQPGVPDGWAYRVTYPAVEVVADIAAELGAPRGTPYFPATVLDDPAAARLVRTAHRAAERGDALAASSHLRTAIAGLLRRHAAQAPPDEPRPAGSLAVAAARDILHDRLLDPPSLADLAAAVGARPFALLRAFRRTTGLPPHAYLNHARVRRARTLLAGGLRPADVAARVGFADQAHLTRHFKRVVGVPPGAYAAGMRKNVQD
ncbi:MAG TPA: AraC family transcriptional regulator [Streptosporangiaceae bacterium]|nr:AraC family transcriptional regulator [Streptosporangiaceae bacterium]